MQHLHSWGRGGSPQTQRFPIWGAGGGWSLEGLGAESIYQELFNTPSPKKLMERATGGHQSGHQLRTCRAAGGTGWTYTGGEPPWSCCYTKWVTLTLGQLSGEPSRWWGSVLPGGSQSRAGRDQREGKAIVVWRHVVEETRRRTEEKAASARQEG